MQAAAGAAARSRRRAASAKKRALPGAPVADRSSTRDRTGYHRRIEDIARRLVLAAAVAQVKRAIGELEALADDLDGVGDATLARAIREIVDTLRAGLGENRAPTELGREVAASLSALTGGARPAFWK